MRVLLLCMLGGFVVAGGCGQSGREEAPATKQAAPTDPGTPPPTTGKAMSSSPLPAGSPSTVPAHATDGARHTNRLINETSPYLLQHAHNPVDWYPWGEEAFEAARRQDKAIFVSIGYSTCYWCHVMERESFENEQIAALMNEHFICIKVDREERPDVDDIYMAATQALNQGQGGWPMSIFLEPEALRPFMAGTYFPPEDRHGRAGFPRVLTQMAEVWAGQREAVVRQAEQVAALVKQSLSRAAAPRPLGREVVDRAVAQLMSIYDRKAGGFGRGVNKFPMPANIDLLIGVAWEQEAVRDAVLHTLDRMATGGMYDQIGGGFHRYSTDTEWLVPHFEKMLYDNGQLASTYAAAYERTADPYYAEIVRETLDYVLREMTAPDGAFYSAQDAEVNAREGGNYVWVASEVRQVLAEARMEGEIDFALEVYGFNRGPNFLDPHHPEDGRKNVVFLVGTPQVQAKAMGLSLETFNERLDRINRALLRVRDRRDQPGTDDKVLAGWNGLMIAGMADGGRALSEPRYLEAARAAADFVLGSMRTADGGLLRTSRAQKSKIDAFFEDYSLMIKGLIALYRATNDSDLLEQAMALAATARERFWDESHGGYFDTLVGQSDLFVRTKSTYDGAVPCGNTVMLNNLLDLHELSGDESFLDQAEAALRGLSGAIDASPAGSVLASLAIDRFLREYPERLGSPTVAAAEAPKTVVSVTTSTRSLELAPGAAATFELTLEIAEGYHINSHRPGPSFLIPLDLQATGSDGLVVIVDWPAGEPYEGPLAEGEMRIHSGTVTIPVRLEQVGKITGRPQLILTYQVCTDKLCLAPTTEALAMEIRATVDQ